MKHLLLVGCLVGVSLMVVKLTGNAGPAESASHITLTAQTQKNLADCARELEAVDGGWCELRVSAKEPGISNVFPPKQPRVQHAVGPKAVLIAWSSAAWDRDSKSFYFMGGGGMDYGGNEVYRFSLVDGVWTRLTDPSPLDHWTHLSKLSIWIPDIHTVPASSYVNDGLLFNEQTKTIFLLTTQAAKGARIKGDKSAPEDMYIPNGAEPHQYEFNPSATETRNGLAPLSWRQIGDYVWTPGRSVQLPDGTLLLGGNDELFQVTQAKDGRLQQPKLFYKDHKDRGGNAVFDRKRNWVWTLYIKKLVAVDKAGKTVMELDMPMKTSRAFDFDQRGNLVMWDGSTRIFTLNPDAKEPVWHTTNWPDQGPYQGKRERVFGKWVHLGDNLFAGISSYNHGVWIYKHPSSNLGQAISSVNVQKLIDRAEKHSSVKVPAGLYATGLRISKPLTLDLEGVEFMGISGGKGILNIEAKEWPVTIRNFSANADIGTAQTGNLTGIKIAGVDFDVRLENVSIRRTALGVMTDNRGGSLKISDSVFEDIGFYKRKGLSHILYAGAIDSLTVTNSRFQNSMQLGHILKSRAKFTSISNTQLLGLDGRHSRVIDASCGGTLIVKDSILQSGSHSDNQDLIAVGVEKPKNCRQGLMDGDVTLENNVIVMDRVSSTNNKNRLFTWRTAVEHLLLKGNTIVNRDGNDLLQQKIDNVTVKDKSVDNKVYKTRAKAGLSPEPDTRPR